jgi:CspA family cold shock protein
MPPQMEQLRIEPSRIQGAVRRIVTDKGCGFIAGDDGQDYFFHWTAMAPGAKDFRELVQRERVEFNRAMSDRGPRAVNVIQLISPIVPSLN